MSIVEVTLFGVSLGLANSVHCAGMCGVFALRAVSLGGRRVLPFLAYATGKTLTYVFLGALLGYIGPALTRGVTFVQAGLSCVIAWALLMTAWRLARPTKAASAWGASFVSFLAPLLRIAPHGQEAQSRFALGVTTAFLPCGVVYIAGLQAANLGNPRTGTLLMLALSLGTLPVLALLAFGSLPLARAFPRKIIPLARGLLIAGATLTLVRGLAPLGTAFGTPPCCH